MNTSRYDRQERIADWDQRKLTAARVLVVGAGTTGNELVKNLALLGVGHLTIADFDVINEVNLSRSVLFRHSDIGCSKAQIAALRARELNPNVEAVAFDGDIVHGYGSGRYADFDAVILATDNLASRMWVSRACFLQRVWLVNTGIEGWSGNVSIFPPTSDVCLECAWNDSVYAILDKRRSCAGVGMPLTERPIPMVVTTAALVAAQAVHEFVKWIMYRDPHRWNAYDTLGYNALTGQSLRYRSVPNTDCRSGHRRLASQQIEVVPRTQPLGEVRRHLREVYGATLLDIVHDHEIVWSLSCRQCGQQRATSPLWFDGYLRQLCLECGAAEIVPDDVSRYLPDTHTMEEMNIPVGQILTVLCARPDAIETHHVRVGASDP